MAFSPARYANTLCRSTSDTLSCLVDTKITPGGDAAYGAGLFDYPIAVFIAENAIFFFGLWVYRTLAPPASKVGLQQNPNLLTIVSLVMVAQQAQFCFMS